MTNPIDMTGKLVVDRDQLAKCLANIPLTLREEDWYCELLACTETDYQNLDHMVLVPRELTDHMYHTMDRHLNHDYAKGNPTCPEELYKAMIQAAEEGNE